MPNMFIGHNKAKYALISNLTRLDPAQSGLTLSKCLYLRKYLNYEAAI